MDISEKITPVLGSSNKSLDQSSKVIFFSFCNFYITKYHAWLSTCWFDAYETRLMYILWQVGLNENRGNDVVVVGGATGEEELSLELTLGRKY